MGGWGVGRVGGLVVVAWGGVAADGWTAGSARRRRGAQRRGQLARLARVVRQVLVDEALEWDRLRLDLGVSLGGGGEGEERVARQDLEVLVGERGARLGAAVVEGQAVDLPRG